jgi:hypothetical protein
MWVTRGRDMKNLHAFFFGRTIQTDDFSGHGMAPQPSRSGDGRAEAIPLHFGLLK